MSPMKTWGIYFDGKYVVSMSVHENWEASDVIERAKHVYRMLGNIQAYEET